MGKISFSQLLILSLIVAVITFQLISQTDCARRKKKPSKTKTKSREPEVENNGLYNKSRFCADRTNDWGIPYRYYKPKQQCYLVGERGPCNEMMEFTLQDDDYGYCDCDQSQRCGRPLIYWPETKRCYYVNDQGPCASGKWLTFGFQNSPVCRKNPCTKQQSNDASRGQNFWFEKNGKCYKTGSKGYCENSQEILINKWNDYRPSCSEDEVIKCGGFGYIHKMECLPGMKLDYYQHCISEMLKNRTQEAELAALEAAKTRRPPTQFYPYETFPEDDTFPNVYTLVARKLYDDLKF